MAFSMRFNEEKNQLLKATRGIGFDEVIKCLKAGGLLKDKKHTGSARTNQRLYVVKINNYAYVVPYILDEQKEEILLKTVYPSRRFTKLYIKEGDI